MTAQDHPQPSNRALMGRMWREFLRPRWKGFLVSMVSAVIVARLTVMLGEYVEPAVDKLIAHPQPGALVWVPLTIAGGLTGRLRRGAEARAAAL